MIEVQLVRRSRNGVVIPFARSHDEGLVACVARRILKEVENWQFDDETLEAVARGEEEALRQILQEAGILE